MLNFGWTSVSRIVRLPRALIQRICGPKRPPRESQIPEGIVATELYVRLEGRVWHDRESNPGLRIMRPPLCH